MVYRKLAEFERTYIVTQPVICFMCKYENKESTKEAKEKCTDCGTYLCIEHMKQHIQQYGGVGVPL